jgi:hypothetical protein
MITTRDRDVLDIITSLTRDLRRNPKFCEMLEGGEERHPSLRRMVAQSD